MSEEEELIIIISKKKNQARSEDTVYDTARALIDEAELAGTQIVFQDPDHEPQDPAS